MEEVVEEGVDADAELDAAMPRCGTQCSSSSRPPGGIVSPGFSAGGIVSPGFSAPRRLGEGVKGGEIMMSIRRPRFPPHHGSSVHPPVRPPGLPNVQRQGHSVAAIPEPLELGAGFGPSLSGRSPDRHRAAHDAR